DPGIGKRVVMVARHEQLNRLKCPNSACVKGEARDRTLRHKHLPYRCRQTAGLLTIWAPELTGPAKPHPAVQQVYPGLHEAGRQLTSSLTNKACQGGF